MDAIPRTLASRGVTCGIVSTPTCCSISAEATSAFMRARASGLSLTSKASTPPASDSRRAVEISRSTLPPLGGSSSTETTNSPRRSLPASADSAASATAATGSSRSTRASALAGARRSATASRTAAMCTGAVPQQPPISIAPSRTACAAYSAKYSGDASG
jgi:hypothetical protein